MAVPKNISADLAVSQLKAGNLRFIEEATEAPRRNEAHRSQLVDGQSPFAVVLTCADSRVDPTLLFDQGLGDLFVIKVAGNILGRAILGSIEYAVEHLGVNLVLVLGHESCGAVQAALDEVTLDLNIDRLVEAITPAVIAVQGQPGDPLDNAVRANVHHVVASLKTDIHLLSLIGARAVKVLPAYYSLRSGLVEWLKAPA